MQKSLGGDRLGSGKKMKVELHNYERSTHDMGYLWRSTMAAGTLVPFMKILALPGDTFDIDLDCDIKTHPTIGPLFGSYKVQLDVFQAPVRLYNSLLHNNALGIGLDMSRVKLPVIGLGAKVTTEEEREDIDNCQVNPSSVLSYLGIRGAGFNGTIMEPQIREFNAVPFLALWDIYKNYYANKQEEIGAVIHSPFTIPTETVDSIEVQNNAGIGTTIPEASLGVPGNVTMFTGDLLRIPYTGTPPNPDQIIINTLERGEVLASDIVPSFSNDGTELFGPLNFTGWWSAIATYWRYVETTDTSLIKPQVVTFPLQNIDTMRKYLLAWNSETVPYNIQDSLLPPYIWAGGNTGSPEYINFALSSQEGLPIKTYQSDLFNNWLSTEWNDDISAITAISTIGDSFTIDTLNLSKKVYDMLNRIAVSGGTYDDWLDAVYAHDRYQRCETPMYMGGLSKELVFQEVISNTQTESQPLGTLAGRGIMSNKHKGGKVTIKVDEPSYIMGIISLTPRLDYSQGNDWDVTLQTLDDFHKPALDEIGFQELITEQMAWWSTTHDGTNWVQHSAGKQPAWINYMTSVNQTKGNFAISTNEMFMTLNRRYEFDLAEDNKMGDLTTYIDPSKYNFIFAETATDAQNFWAQIAVDITARRKMSAKVMPNL